MGGIVKRYHYGKNFGTAQTLCLSSGVGSGSAMFRAQGFVLWGSKP